jgi:Domain of unknown function (DUF4270)
MNLPVVKNHFILFFLLSALLFSSCTKIVTTDIGGGLIPPVDGVNTKEMYMDIFSKNVKDTVARVSTTWDHTLGYVNDPLFGQTTASINVQLKPTSFPFTFPVRSDSLYFDSLVLVLSYKSVWGDSTQPLSLKVFDILQDGPSNEVDLKPDSAYRTDFYVPSGEELTLNGMAKTVLPMTLDDSVKPDPFLEQASNQLRITLDTNSTFAQNLLRHYSSLGVFQSDSLFDEFIKGFQVIPQAVGNSLLKINLADTNTKLAIYFRYKDRDSGALHPALRYFKCNSYTCGSTNYIVRNRNGAKITSWLPPNNDTPNDSLIFIDAQPGVYANLHIPGIDTISNKIIHRAEILMEQVPDDWYLEPYFTPPNLVLAPYSTDSMKRFVLPNDVSVTGSAISNQYALGYLPQTKTDPITGRTIYFYSFDVSRYVQGIITRKEKSYDLQLFAPFNDFIYYSELSPILIFTGYSTSSTLVPLNDPAIGRVRLGGGNNSKYKMTLHIVYSEL